jgi:predicted ATPase
VTAAGAEPFVGRDDALAALEQAWSGVRRGSPRLVLVTGDAGIGKSTLVARFLDGRTGALVLRGGCFGLVSAELPYAPVVQALRPLAEVPDAAPLCAALTGSGEPAPGEATRWAQSRLFETTLRLLGGLSRQRPVVLALEDVHWADRATLDLLLFLLGNVVTERVLVLLTARCDEPDDPDWLRDALHRLTSGRSAELLELPPLEAADATRLAAALGADDDAARRHRRW